MPGRSSDQSTASNALVGWLLVGYMNCCKQQRGRGDVMAAVNRFGADHCRTERTSDPNAILRAYDQSARVVTFFGNLIFSAFCRQK